MAVPLLNERFAMSINKEESAFFAGFGERVA